MAGEGVSSKLAGIAMHGWVKELDRDCRRTNSYSRFLQIRLAIHRLHEAPLWNRVHTLILFQSKSKLLQGSTRSCPKVQVTPSQSAL